MSDKPREPLVVLISEVESTNSDLVRRMVERFNSLGTVIPCVITGKLDAIDYIPSVIEVPAARCCVTCKDEIPEGTYHGCRTVRFDKR